MKKIFGALMIAVCIGMAMPAQAQLHFGVKGGLNLSKASFSDVKENFKIQYPGCGIRSRCVFAFCSKRYKNL